MADETRKDDVAPQEHDVSKLEEEWFSQPPKPSAADDDMPLLDDAELLEEAPKPAAAGAPPAPSIPIVPGAALATPPPIPARPPTAPQPPLAPVLPMPKFDAQPATQAADQLINWQALTI
ncbi:MAG: hypothetical protein HY897_21945 [Deltaproteobacteria bacterium]|nr:hypothetical protein [Deltaproteobacteria bacterium]